jgi:streptogramin lyase
VSWRTYTIVDGLADSVVASIVEDRAGNLWFGTNEGVSRYDGVNWETYGEPDGLADENVNSILEDRSGNLWFGTWRGGVSRYDGVSWRTYTTADGLADNEVTSILEDRSGNLWFGTSEGVSRYDGVSWLTFTEADGLGGASVQTILEDGSGNLWFGMFGGGASRYDGISWRTFTEGDGLAGPWVRSILEDDSGNLWFGTNRGLSQYDGVSWRTYTTADGLAGTHVTSILEDGSENLWFGTYEGVTQYAQDRVPPHTVFISRPIRLSTSTTHAVTFCAAFREVWGITFSYSFDGSVWSDWSTSNAWMASELCDGEHVFMVKGRDKAGNVESTPAVCVFEIDATPPLPVITFPASREAVRDSVTIRGAAADLRFKKYLVELRSSSGASLDTLVESSSPVADGVLCGWNTLPLPDGDYEVRLSVTDTLGLTSATLVRVIVDNQAPWAEETAPAILRSGAGGNIYTTNREVHLYFPPHAFAQDTEVNIVSLSESDVPDTLESGARRVLAGYEISWGTAVLDKPATLEMSYAGAEMSLTASQCADMRRSFKVSDEGESSPAPATSWAGDIATSISEGHSPPVDGALSLYVFGSDSTWQRLGGTVDGSAKRISCAISEAGRYAIYADAGGVLGPSTLSNIAVTPRVFSPRGAFANEEAAISFSLGRPGPVTVKVYNRAGHLVREVASSQPMNAGANLVRWDGRDSDTNLVEDGLYLVVVEALGQKQVKTLAVVR